MIQICCFKWKPDGEYRSKFDASHVNTLKNMVKRNLSIEHEFVCVTDDPQGLDPDIRVVKLWLNPVPNYGCENRPNCFRRIRAFAPDMETIIGKRFVWLDLDTVVVGQLDPLFDIPDDFKMWGGTHPTTPYNGSMVLMNAGARAKVWDKFNPRVSPLKGRERGHIGSDQAWISYCLGSGEKKWDTHDGVYSFRIDILAPKSGLPDDARIVFFHGRHNPWDENVQKNHPWVRRYYR